ncbi:MAG: PKD domain-containing protein [Flavobacteriales bacterium]|nr:PKD domain-containing protein [Flavobacteriales bacterium]
MRTLLQNLSVAFLMVVSTNLIAQTNINVDKIYQVKDLLDDKILNVEIKEHFVREIRKTGLVPEIDNHDFEHFVLERYEIIYKPLIKNELSKFNQISQSHGRSLTVNIIAEMAKDFNTFKKKNPNYSAHNYNINSEDVDVFKLTPPINPDETYGPGQPCNNADFETGNCNGWEVITGTVPSAPSAEYSFTQTGTSACGTSPNHVIMTGGTDAQGGFPRVYPGSGGTSVMLGDGTGVNNGAARIRQTFLVDANSAAFSYHYAVVLNDAGHSSIDQPYFSVRMFDQGGNSIACGAYEVVAPTSSGSDPNFTSYPGGFYSDWRSAFAPLQGYIGQNVTIEFTTGDCSASGHYGYAYIDANCDPLQIIPSQTVICGGQPVTLTAPAGASSYSWSPGGETTQSITTNVPGHYEVFVTPVTGAACGLTLTADIGGSPDYPVAQFTANPTNVCVGTPITFTNTSYVVGTSSIDSVQWDFNSDGIVDNTTFSPTYTYPSAGNYTATLTVFNNGCEDETTQNVTITPGTTASFTTTPVCQGVPTSFTNTSSGGANTWGWDFDSNTTIDNSSQNPTFTFATAGTHAVTLNVSNSGSCPHDTTINVIVHPNPVANFTATDECLTTATTFTDASNVSTGSITGWSWDFDNNTTTDNTSQNPTHTYGTAGTQTINLTVTTDNNCTNSYSTTVEVFANPIANFSTDAPCEGNATTFTDLSSDGSVAISIWNWDFDNNTTTDNTTQNPTFNLGTANTYPVTLYVEDANGCNHSVTQNVIVNPNPTAGFTFTNVCFGTTTGFTNQSNGNGGTINQFAWDFTNNGTVDNTNQNPTNGYPSAGTYTVELHVTTADGCVDSITRVVTVNPIPVADFSSTTECLGNLTTFTDESTVSTGGVTNWSWDFNDGSPADNSQNPTHVYASAGIYNVTLTVTSDSGCINNYTANVEVYTNPVATFSTDVACLTYATTFTDSSTPGDNPITIWNWDFDNNTTVDNTEQNPTFILPTAGTHNVNLYVEDSHGCNHDTTITVTVSENPIADFDHTIECFGTSTTFTDASNNNGGTTNIDTWEWDFDGNGTIDNTTQSPTFNFPSAGNYPTELVVTSALGCKDSITINVVVDPIPVANFTATTACLEYTTTFTNNSTVATGSITQNDWDFADGTGTSALLNPTYTYTTAGTFNVELTVTSDSGCVHSVIVPVTVHPKPTADFNVTDVCLNVAAPITDASVGNGGTVNQWQWDFTNNGTTDNTTQNPSNLYATDGTFDIKLVVSTTNSCKDTIIKPVTIHPMPTADFIFVNACYGAGIDFTDTSNVTSGTITNWDWSFGNGQTSTLENPTENYAAEGIYNVQLIVTTNNNCKDTVSKNNIEVWPLPVVDFIPTTVCLNNITQFEDQSTVSNTYTTNTITAWSWNFGDGSPLDDNQDPTHTYLTEGVHQATLVVTTSNNCIDSITKDVTVNPLPVVNFVADNFEDCAPVDVTFTDSTAISSGTISKWFWDFNSDGYTDNYGPNPQWSFPNPSHSSVRNYNVTLITESDKGCRDTLTIPNYIHSYPNPLASFMYWPNDQATIVDKELTFTDQSIIGSVWHWDMGDGFTSSVQHPVHEFPDTGFYLVTLAIENVYGCVDTTQKYVQIKPMYAIWIPNAFTPDGDFTNDYFYVDGYGIKELQIQIFDRWGLKIYDEIGIDQSWDGTYKGNLVPTDVYVYKVRAKDIFDEWHDYIGRVSVIK